MHQDPGQQQSKDPPNNRSPRCQPSPNYSPPPISASTPWSHAGILTSTCQIAQGIKDETARDTGQGSKQCACQVFPPLTGWAAWRCWPGATCCSWSQGPVLPSPSAAQPTVSASSSPAWLCQVPAARLWFWVSGNPGGSADGDSSITGAQWTREPDRCKPQLLPWIPVPAHSDLFGSFLE